MKKNIKLSWKPYIKRAVITVAGAVLLSKGINLAMNPDVKYPILPIKVVTESPADSLQKIILNLSPEKRLELRKLYELTYSLAQPGAILKASNMKIFEDLLDIEKQVEWRDKGDVAIKNDTIHMQDKDTLALGWHIGLAYNNAPQINIHYFQYNGEINSLKKLAKNKNPYNVRLKIVFHELRHVDNFRYIIDVPKEQRGRAISAANELFATIAGDLGDYAYLDSGSKQWDKSYRTKINVWDVNYKLPKNSGFIIDSVIISALSKLENSNLYRKIFIEDDKMGYSSSLELHYNEKASTQAQAISKMQSAFKINGKSTDILSLASKKVRQRAENFINFKDEDMKLVVAAHKNNIRF